MKKAIALGVLLGASFVSFAFAQTLPVAKNYDLYSNLNTRATVELSGTSVGSVAFGSWRDYSIDPTIANPTVRDQGILSVSAAPGYYSATRVEVNISPTSGSFTRISPECGGESRTNIISLKWFSDPKKLPTTGGFCLLESNKKYYFNIRYIKEDGTPACSQSTCGMYVDISYGGFVDSTKSISVPFTPAPIVLNSAGTPIVTSTYDLNAHPATRLIPATGGTRSVAIAFPTTKGGTFMMSPGVNEYIRPDRTEVNISTKPNDFTPIQPACNQVNEISSEINLQWVIKASDQPSWGACILEPNKIYYFNIRYVKADGTTACTQATCGAYVDLPPLGTISVASSANTQPSNLPKDCTTLSNNLALGSKDSNTNNEVTALQSFLSPMYLKVSPTGYYGNMTVAAVKAFQKEYGIDQVGRIGPTTRAKVQQLSCGENTTSASYTSPVAKSVVTQSQPTQNGTMQISSPWGGQNLRNTGVCTGEGCSFIPPITIIRWSGGTGDIATIDLYDTRNVKVKTIAQTSNSGSYIWNYDPSLYDGPYKIAIRAGNGYAETGYFMIGEGTNQITPNPIVVTCPTGQTLVNGVCQTTQPTVANTTPCPAVPSKSRTYSREQRSSWWDAQISGTTGVNTVTLGHYKYPETTEVGTFTYYGERCALSATPGTRTCPYTDSIYGSGADRNAYSILLHAPDPTNDPNEVGDRVYTAYKKPIVGFSRYNRAFDMSLPFKISASEVGKKFDFHYTVENQNLANEGQYSISECEGDFSERAVLVGNYGQGGTPRANLMATSDLEGSKFTPGNSSPWVALKTNKVYYFNIRWIKTKAVGAYSGASCVADANNNCLSPFVPTDQIPDSGIHDHALARQIRNGANDDALEFYRWDISQQNDGYFGNGISTEAQLRVDPLFDQPGGAVLSPGLYYPSCNAGGTVNWGIRGSDCQVKCMTGYIPNAGQCVRQ